MRLVLGLVLGIGAACSGCAGPRPATPSAAAVIPPVAWRAGPLSGLPVGMRWWTSFRDPVLDGLVEKALANNVDIAIAAARVAESRAQSDLARAQRLPTVDASAAGAASRTLNPFGIGADQTAGQSLLTTAYDVDLFGRLSSADASARASLLASQAASDTVQLAVAASTAIGYLTLRTLDARLAVAEKTLKDRTAALRFARRRAESGYTSMLELSQAQAEYETTAQLIPQAELAVVRQENALKVLVGENPGNIARGLQIQDIPVPAVPGGLPADLLRRRPDIAQAERQIVAADRTLDAARAAFMPDIRLTGSAGLVLSTLLPNPVTLWSLGGSILAPIFQGGRLRAQAGAAAARRDQAAYAYRKAALTAFREVEDGLAASSLVLEQLDAFRRQRSALANALRISTNRYQAGYAPYLDQLDAQRGLLSADLSVIQAESDRLVTAVMLYQAMGGGWQA